ncbi:MAG: DUF4255 domain-containing protein [Candidatus Accumulibacter sp.]|uniref:DUF4255 domain-containing protein n=1 Tax=Candidatus Accumulibacter proximus TaxID=2954385 RepID=A0A935PZJ3_9PROT|nr:DUF4255 domain-containing protein [Candidatus Accumulibacter proximus]
MATHRAILGVLQALKERLDLRLPALVGGSPKSVILGSQALTTAPTGENLGIYLHRMAVDPFARNRYLAPTDNHRQRRPELPVNLHILLIGWSTKNDSEISYLAAAMQIIGSALTLDVSHLGTADSGWDEREVVQVLPEEMSTEDLMRLWDSLPGDYRLSSPYLIKTVRLAPDEERAEAPLVRTIVLPTGTTGQPRVEGKE